MTMAAQLAAEGSEQGHPRWPRIGFVVVLLVAVAALVTACGGSGSTGIASLRSTGTKARTRSNGAASSAARKSGVLYASCMRAHGISNFPDPEAGGGFDIPLSLDLKSNPQWHSTVQACQSDLPGGGPASKLREHSISLRSELKFATCLRSHGITDFPDPNSQGTFHISGGINMNSPQFEAANTACQKLTSGIPIAISPGSNGA
jgi:hypothetical protein